MTLNILTPIVNKVHEMLSIESARHELSSSMVSVTKDSLRGMSEFVLVGSLIPASIMAGAIKAFDELSLNLEDHCEQLLFASIEGALAVNITLTNAVYGSCFQLLNGLIEEEKACIVDNLNQAIDQHKSWTGKQKKVAKRSLNRAIKDTSEN